MYIYNDKWTVHISETNYDPDSMDNVIRPDAYIKICDDYTKTLLLSIADVSRTIEKKILLSVSYYTPHDEYAFLVGNNLIMFLNDIVCEFNIQTGKIRKKELSLIGPLFAVYRYQEDFILYSEGEIVRMNLNLDVLWDFGVGEIFVRYQDEKPAFEMGEDRIKLYDFSGNYYEIDYDGKLLSEIRIL